MIRRRRTSARSFLAASVVALTATACGGAVEEVEEVDSPIATSDDADLADDDEESDLAADDESDSVEDDELRDRIDATADVFGDLDDATPGCAVGVEHPGGTHLAAFGMADLDAGEPIGSDTVFDMGSVSKQFTAGAVALLVEDGLIDLDDSLSDHVDGLGDLADEVTVADLVHHTSGLPDYIPLLDADDDEVTTNDDVIDIVSSDSFDLDADPGTEFDYSNTNYVLLAVLVEEVTGRAFPEVSRERIFDPLDMTSTVVRDDQGTLLDGQARGYEDADGAWLPVGSSWRQTGDGAVHGTVGDLLEWAGLFLPSGAASAASLGGDGWRELILTGGDVDDDGVPYAFGIGIEDGGATLTHAGSWIGYGSILTVRPGDDVAVAIACNIDGYDVEDAADRVLDAWL